MIEPNDGVVSTHPRNRKWNTKLILFMLNLAWATWIPLLYALYLYFESRSKAMMSAVPTSNGDNMVIAILTFAGANLVILLLMNLAYVCYSRRKNQQAISGSE